MNDDQVKAPNDDTIKAIDESEAIRKSNTTELLSLDELFEALCGKIKEVKK